MRLPAIGEEPVFDNEILLSAYYAHEVKSGGKVPPADDDEVVAKDSTPSGWARTMDELHIWARDNGWAFHDSSFIDGPNKMSAFLTKSVKKGERITGIFGQRRERKPRTKGGRIVGLKLHDDPDGSCVYMAINDFCPALFVNDPHFPGAKEKCKEQKVNCYIDEDFDQPDGSPGAVRLRASYDITASQQNPVELWVSYNLTPEGSGHLSRKMSAQSILDEVHITAQEKLVATQVQGLLAKAKKAIVLANTDNLEKFRQSTNAFVQDLLDGSIIGTAVSTERQKSMTVTVNKYIFEEQTARRNHHELTLLASESTQVDGTTEGGGDEDTTEAADEEGEGEGEGDEGDEGDGKVDSQDEFAAALDDAWNECERLEQEHPPKRRQSGKKKKRKLPSSSDESSSDESSSQDDDDGGKKKKNKRKKNVDNFWDMKKN